MKICLAPIVTKIIRFWIFKNNDLCLIPYMWKIWIQAEISEFAERIKYGIIEAIAKKRI